MTLMHFLLGATFGMSAINLWLSITFFYYYGCNRERVVNISFDTMLMLFIITLLLVSIK